MHQPWCCQRLAAIVTVASSTFLFHAIPVARIPCAAEDGYCKVTAHSASLWCCTAWQCQHNISIMMMMMHEALSQVPLCSSFTATPCDNHSMHIAMLQICYVCCCRCRYWADIQTYHRHDQPHAAAHIHTDDRLCAVHLPVEEQMHGAETGWFTPPCTYS